MTWENSDESPETGFVIMTVWECNDLLTRKLTFHAGTDPYKENSFISLYHKWTATELAFGTEEREVHEAFVTET